MSTATVTLCIVCSKPNLRPRRKTCSDACLHEAHARIAIRNNAAIAPQRRAKATTREHPPCENPDCGKPVEIHDDEVPCHWYRRRACSPRCAVVLSLRARGINPRAIGKYRRPKRRHVRFETVEEARARGLEIQQLPPAFAAPSSAAIR